MLKGRRIMVLEPYTQIKAELSTNSSTGRLKCYPECTRFQENRARLRSPSLPRCSALLLNQVHSEPQTERYPIFPLGLLHFPPMLEVSAHTMLPLTIHTSWLFPSSIHPQTWWLSRRACTFPLAVGPAHHMSYDRMDSDPPLHALRRHRCCGNTGMPSLNMDGKPRYHG